MYDLILWKNRRTEKAKRVQNYLYSCAKETAYYGVTIPGSRFTMGGL